MEISIENLQNIRSTVVTGQTEGLKDWLQNGWMAGWVNGWAEEWVICKSCRAKLYKVEDFKQIGYEKWLQGE